MTKIKNIIFDLGGVILNIDYTKTSKSFRDLGVLNFDDYYTQNAQKELFDQYETGKITSAEFRSSVKSTLDLQVQDDKFDEAWNAMLLDLPKERLEFIKKLRSQYKVLLFSNTNAIHLAKIYEKEGANVFSSVFDKEYFSNIYGKRKPDPDAFLAILKENNMNADETLFIDDTQRHIEGAKKAGLHTVHLTKDQSILNTEKFIQSIKNTQTEEKKNEPQTRRCCAVM